jgi:hypothetical protein
MKGQILMSSCNKLEILLTIGHLIYKVKTCCQLQKHFFQLHSVYCIVHHDMPVLPTEQRVLKSEKMGTIWLHTQPLRVPRVTKLPTKQH